MSKVKKLNIFLLILSVIIIFVSGFSSRNIEILMRSLSFAINFYIFIVSIVSIKKSSILILIISLLLTLFFGFATVSGAISNIKINKYQKSEKFYIEQAKQLEDSLSDSAKYYYDLEYYIENLDVNNFKITKNQAEKDFNEKWYNLTKEELGACEGYTIISVNQPRLNEIIDNYKREMNTDTYKPEYIVSYDYSNIMDSLSIKTFINCNGNYSYTTDGFNNNEEVF